MSAKKTGGAAAVAPFEPKSVTRTPSGIEIAYWPGDGKPRSKNKRMYRLRTVPPETPLEDQLDAAGWAELPECPSVTTILKCLDKPALTWWGMRVGIKGFNQLWNDGYLAIDNEGRLLCTIDATWQYATPENIEQLFKECKLTTNDVVSEASDRGQSAHGAFESWAAVGKLPDPAEYPPEEHDYIVALRKFCDDMGDAWTTEGVEVAVGSAEHGFAGRYDLRGVVTKDVRLVARCLTKDGKSPLVAGPQYTTVPEGTRLLIDLKTSKSIYNTHLLQLEAYEGAGIECGYDPTDARAVLHISAHGEYQFKRTRASFEDFLAILHTYHALARVEEAL